MNWDRLAVPHAPFVLASLGLTLAHVVGNDGSFASRAFETALPLSLAAVLAYFGVRFGRADYSRRQAILVGTVVLGGGVYGAGFVAFIGWFQTTHGVALSEWNYLIAVAGIGGVTLAAPIGEYYVRYTNRLAESRASERTAKRLQRRLSVLDRTLRHNVRNELTVATGWVDTLAADDERVDRDRAVEIVRESLDRIERLGDTAREIDRAVERAPSEGVDLREAVHTAVGEVDTGAATVRTELPAAAEARCQPQFGDAVREAVENAVQHNAAAELTVTVRVEAAADGWEITVRDDGRGLPQTEIEAREHGAERALTHGEGLGLLLIETLAEQSGGEMDVRVGEDGGTTIRLWVPATAGDEPTVAPGTLDGPGESAESGGVASRG